MSEHLEQESDVIALLKKIQQQMVFLEKKLDLLVSQQQTAADQQPSFKERHFSPKPFRSYGPPQGGGYGRPDRGGSDRGPRDRGERGGFSQDRPSYGRPRRDDRPNGGPPSGGRPGFGGGRPGFGGPKKSFYKGRKDRD